MTMAESAFDKNDVVIVRAATRSDMVEVANMIQELADFEKMPEGPKLTAVDLIRDSFEIDPPLFRCKIAESLEPKSSDEADRVLGYALYFNTYSTWEGRTLMLEDLYVRMSQRGTGVGGKLFDSVALEAVSTGCSRLDFHVLRWNPARQFYERRGATNLTDTEQWCFYRLTGDHLTRAASSAQQ